MNLIDYLIIALVPVMLIVVSFLLKGLTRGVADFLAANRCGGRYLLTVAEGSAGLGAISIVSQFELYYQGGFTPAFWQLVNLPVVLVLTLSGWVIYRFRATRALTLAQMLEMRYSKRLRIFAGSLAFLAGLINYGIFPAVTARFFMSFCQMPSHIGVFSLTLPVYPLVMMAILGSALVVTLRGGQTAVMITDFIQGQFINIALLAIIFWFFIRFDWITVVDTLKVSEGGKSFLDPFDIGDMPDFNIWYYLIGIYSAFYTHMAWQGTQGYNAAALSPHEARMGKVLSNWRLAVSHFAPVLLPICALVVLTHASEVAVAEQVMTVLDAMPSEQLRTQQTTTAVLAEILPVGLLGLFAAVMFTASISTDSSYMHSWGSILIQDIILPLRGKPLSPKMHLLVLRIAIFSVAAFAFTFSLLFQQSQNILLFWMLSGAIYLGGAGAVVIGGLYWSRGTTQGAYAALIVGSTIGVGGLIVRQVDPDFFLNGAQIYFMSMVCSSVSYFIVSMLGKQRFDLKTLMAGEAQAAQATLDAPKKSKGLLSRLGISEEFTKRDRLVYFLTMLLAATFMLSFFVGLIWHFTGNADQSWWIRFWTLFIGFKITLALIVTVWFLIGGSMDVRSLIRRLRSGERDKDDDGHVDPLTSQ